MRKIDDELDKKATGKKTGLIILELIAVVAVVVLWQVVVFHFLLTNMHILSLVEVIVVLAIAEPVAFVVLMAYWTFLRDDKFRW